jgi:beta-galactosidase
MNLKNYYPPYNDKQIFFDGHPRYSSSYDNAGVRITARQSWKRTQENPWILGEFRWTGFDYLGEASFGGGQWPARIWNFGIIDLCGFPKDHYYFYQSQWTQEPMVHILPHWTHPGMEGVEIPVVGYSNCDAMELFLNGQSLGRKTPGELLDFVWKVPYRPGELKAVGYRDGRAAATKIVQTAQSPTEIKLSADNVNLEPHKSDISHLTITIQDEANHVVPWACNRIDFKIDGPVRLLGFDNGDPLDVTSHRERYRNTFNGLALGIFQGVEEEGPIEITAAGILGRPRFEEKTTVAIDVSRIALRGQLKDADFDVTYSVNGSGPVPYTGPFELSETAAVNAFIKKNAEQFITLESKFIKGPLPKVTDVRFKNPEPRIQQTIDGPAAKELVGEWVLVKDKKLAASNRVEVKSSPEFIFTPTGSAFVVEDGKKRLFGFWTYEYPENPKNSADVGNGKMFMFITDAYLHLKLDSAEAKVLEMKSSYNHYTLRRK